MNNLDNKYLPTDRKFGLFFIIVTLIISIYFFFKRFEIAFYISIITSIFFIVTTLYDSYILRPLNKMWMNFGIILGMIFNPIVIGVIYFFIITPIGILIRLFGRDELLLQFKSKSSYWIDRNEQSQSTSFRKQF